MSKISPIKTSRSGLLKCRVGCREWIKMLVSLISVGHSHPRLYDILVTSSRISLNNARTGERIFLNVVLRSKQSLHSSSYRLRRHQRINIEYFDPLS